MNDDDLDQLLERLRAEHRRLDDQIGMLSAQADTDQLELARLKKRKLRLRDQIQLVIDQRVPDIIA
jgi:hypothetical protein